MTIKRRLERLEQQLQPPAVYAVYLADTDRVGVCDGSREKLPLAEFQQRYPHGVFVQMLAHEWMWDALMSFDIQIR